MKKTFIIVVICITTMVCMMSCSNNKPSEVTEIPVEEIPVDEIPVDEIPVDEIPVDVLVEESEVGTYTFSDYLQKYELTLNNDGTAVLKATEMNLTDYGSWKILYSSYGEPICVECSGDQFRITLPNGTMERTSFMYLRDGYVYFGYTEQQAKHPKKRLAYTKR